MIKECFQKTKVFSRWARPVAAPSSHLGPLVRLWGIRVSELPQSSSPPEELQPFVISILEEAIPFLDSIPTSSATAPADQPILNSSKSEWMSRGSYSYPGCNAEVTAFQRTVTSQQLRDIAAKHSIVQESSRDFHTELWACRHSEHEDAARKGTGCWNEFEQCFRDQHAEAEKAFTPSIVDREMAVLWNCEGITATIAGKTWGNITLKLEESRHRVGFPLNDRAFAVLQMTATVLGAQEFVVVSIAVNEARSFPLCRVSKSPGVVTGAYSSVEHIRKLPQGTIGWTIATASDARGILPLWLQALAVPSKIRQDVPLFFVWLANQKTRGKGRRIIPQ